MTSVIRTHKPSPPAEITLRDRDRISEIARVAARGTPVVLHLILPGLVPKASHKPGTAFEHWKQTKSGVRSYNIRSAEEYFLMREALVENSDSAEILNNVTVEYNGYRLNGDKFEINNRDRKIADLFEILGGGAGHKIKGDVDAFMPRFLTFMPTRRSANESRLHSVDQLLGAPAEAAPGKIVLSHLGFFNCDDGFDLAHKISMGGRAYVIALPSVNRSHVRNFQRAAAPVHVTDRVWGALNWEVQSCAQVMITNEQLSGACARIDQQHAFILRPEQPETPAQSTPPEPSPQLALF